MERQEFNLAASERACQAVSPAGAVCNFVPAVVHCPKCGTWFCDAHAEDEHWHRCALEPQDQVREA